MRAPRPLCVDAFVGIREWRWRCRWFGFGWVVSEKKRGLMLGAGACPVYLYAFRNSSALSLSSPYNRLEWFGRDRVLAPAALGAVLVWSRWPCPPDSSAVSISPAFSASPALPVPLVPLRGALGHRHGPPSLSPTRGHHVRHCCLATAYPLSVHTRHHVQSLLRRLWYRLHIQLRLE